MNDKLLDRNCALLDGACKCKSIKECKYATLYDKGCTFPECQCKVPDWAMSQDVRKQFCKEQYESGASDKEWDKQT